jgi:hypothetical protein
VEYRQVGDLVLIGEEQPWEYYDWAYKQDGYAGGTITRRSRTLSRPKPTEGGDTSVAGEAGTVPATDDPEAAYIDVTGCAATERQAFLKEMEEIGTLDKLGDLTKEKKINHR